MDFRAKSLVKERWTWPVLFMIVLPWAALLYSPDPWGSGLQYAGKTYYLQVRCAGNIRERAIQFNTTIMDSGPLFLLSLVVGLQQGLLEFAEGARKADSGPPPPRS
jgi:hypothetical protein